MSFLDNLINRFKPEGEDDGYIDDGYEDNWEDEPEEDRRFRKPSLKTGIFQKKVIDGGGQTSKIITVKPKGMEDCKSICNYLLDGQSVILNMEGIPTDVAQRIIDFSLGATYAIDGNLQEVSRYIFVASPVNVELSGDFQEDISKKGTAPLNRQEYGSSGFRFNS